MKLLRCHIISFGALADQTVTFDEHLNTFMRENGTGKSTFAAFLRAMLYGLPGAQKRKIEENDRKKYAPWNTAAGGRFGGWIEFSCSRGRFRLTRLFGEKESEDQCVLEDLDTNLALDKNEEYADLFEPGSTLFGLDSESFERTLFFSERDMRVENKDSVTQRLSALTSGDDDSFEKAMKLLDKRRLYYSGKNGEIENIEAQKYALGKKLEDVRSAQRSAEEAKKARMQIAIALARAKAEEAELVDAMRAINERGEQKQILLRGRKACDRISELTEKQENIKERIEKNSARIPEKSAAKEQLRALGSAVGDYRRALADIEELDRKNMQRSDSPAHLLFEKNGVPTEEEVNLHIGERSAADALEKRASDLEAVFSTTDSTAAGRARARLTPRERASVARSLFVCFSIIGFAAVLAGIELLIATAAHKTAAIILIAAGAPALLLGAVGVIVSSFVVQRRQKHEKERRNEIEELRRQAEEKRRSCESFARQYGVDTPNIGKIFALKAEYCLQTEEKERVASQIKQKREAAEKLAAEIRESLGERFDDKAILPAPKAFESVIEAVQSELHELEASRVELTGLAERIEENEKEKNAVLAELFADNVVPADFDFAASYAAICEKTDPGQEKNLAERLADTKMNIEYLNGEIGRLDERFKNEEEIADELPDVESDFDFCSQKYENAKKTLDLIEKTQDFLKTAKNRLSSAYLGGMQTEFKSIFEKIIGTDNENVRIDTKFGVKLDRDGMSRDAAHFSRGYQCVMGFAMRISLVKTIFRDKETPVFLLDDPFAGLDDRRFEAMKTVVKELSEQYQIFYFTCTSQRDLQ